MKNYLLFILLLMTPAIYFGCSSSSLDYLNDADGYYNSFKRYYDDAMNYYITPELKDLYKDAIYLASVILASSLENYINAMSAEPKLKDSILYNSNYCWACYYAHLFCPESDIEYWLNKALICHLKRIQLFPNDDLSYGWVIDISNKLGKYEIANEYAEKLLELGPSKHKNYDSIYVYDWLVYLNDKLKNYEKVIIYGEELLKFRQNIDDYELVAKAYKETGNLEKWEEYQTIINNKKQTK